MSRGLGAAALAAATGEVVHVTHAVELIFASGPVRLNGSTVPLTIGGQEFLGVGLLGGISELEETGDLQSAGCTLRLAGVPQDAIALALEEGYQGRAATVWLCFLDAAGALIEAVVTFRGRMDQMTVRYGETCIVEVTVEDQLTDMDRPNLRLYTDEDQQRQFPGDRFFRFGPRTAEVEITWPSRSFVR